jgi:hypothetical protein
MAVQITVSGDEKPEELYDASEQDVLLDVFKHMLGSVTKDGGRKRARGEKPPWWRDQAHVPAIFSHINKYMHGDYKDPDSGAHTLIHLAWRALAVAYQETYGKRDPVEVLEFAKTTVGGQPAFPGFDAAYDMGLTEIEIPDDFVGLAGRRTLSLDPIICACGCGESFIPQKQHRPQPQRYLHGHRPNRAVLVDLDLDREHFEPGTFKDDALYRSGYGRPSSVLAEHIRQQREQEGAV